MKKLFISLYILLLALPVYATHWIQIDEKLYFDADSVQQYNSLMTYLYPNRYLYWEKQLNDNSLPFIRVAQSTNKKIEFVFMQTIIDCNQRNTAMKSYIYYTPEKEVAYNYEFDEYNLKWMSIPPNSYGELYFQAICQMR